MQRLCIAGAQALTWSYLSLVSRTLCTHLHNRLLHISHCKCSGRWLTCAIPCESRRVTPIEDGVAPFFASLVMWSFT